MSRVETTRFVMNMPTELFKEMDAYATKMNINRTSAVCVLLSQALNSNKIMTDLPELLKIYQDAVNQDKKQA